MAGRIKRFEAGLTVVLWLALVAILGTLATVWSLARPGEDPVGALAERLGEPVTAYRTWLARGPGGERTDWETRSLLMVDGDADEGARLIAFHGCGACHVVPGIPRARGTVGPPLGGFRHRAYVAGILPNRPGDLIDWLQSPPRHNPETAMPDMGLTEAEATHMAAYLYTLGGR